MRGRGRLTRMFRTSSCLVASLMFRTFSRLVSSCTCDCSLASDSFSLGEGGLGHRGRRQGGIDKRGSETLGREIIERKIKQKRGLFYLHT